jgi:hypothetical protein
VLTVKSNFTMMSHNGTLKYHLIHFCLLWNNNPIYFPSFITGDTEQQLLIKSSLLHLLNITWKCQEEGLFCQVSRTPKTSLKRPYMEQCSQTFATGPFPAKISSPIPSHDISFLILILSSHPLLGLPSGIFTSSSQTTMLCAFSFSHSYYKPHNQRFTLEMLDQWF